MRWWLTALVVVATLVMRPAGAAELDPGLQALFDHFHQHRRVAAAYLRTKNADLGAVEIERMRDRWAADLRELPPGTLEDQLLAAAIGETVKTILASLAAIDRGDVESARGLLEGASAPLNAWRKSHGIRLFSDCIAEIRNAHEQLDAHRANPPDLRNIALGGVIVVVASLTESALARCDGEAPDKIRTDAEFRRLVDGMAASLRQVPDAVVQRDGAYLHRLLIEQRSFEQLLEFRYG